MAKAIIRISKQKGGSVGASGHHNDRTRETPNADPERKEQNRILIGDDRNVRETVSRVIEEHGGKPRSDSVECVEMMLTASPEHFMGDNGGIDMKKVEAFREKAVEFLQDRRTGGICVKAVLHLDERTPHIHAHKVPIDDRGKLNCKHYFGTRQKMREFQDAYAEKMQPLGLERGRERSRATHTEVREFYAAIQEQPKLTLNLDRLPDPPRMPMLTEESRKKYKKELAKAVKEQLLKPLATIRHQAMLARDEHAQRLEIEQRAEQRVATAERTRDNVSAQFLAEIKENDKLRKENLDLRGAFFVEQKRTEQLERENRGLSGRVRDIPLEDVMERLGYGREQDGPEFLYRDGAGQVGAFINDQKLYDSQERLLAGNSVEVVLHIKNTVEGENINRAEALTWLSENFGQTRATAAYLVDREQEVTRLFAAQQIEREAPAQMQPDRTTAITPGIEPAVEAPEHQPEHEIDHGISFDR